MDESNLTAARRPTSKRHTDDLDRPDTRSVASPIVLSQQA